MPDSTVFEKKQFVGRSATILSGKFTELIKKIRALDLKDISETGMKFKHFIFTDLRESAFGAKALAGFLIGAGFDFRMANVPKMIKRGGKLVKTKNGEAQLLHKKPVPGGSDSFALLQSLPLWRTPLMVHVKKDILNTYNSRPDNVNGELLRIIVLDSKFKEGIDLKDVKYVHLLEPPIATSDLKQAVGRATRFCGQSGLRFLPSRGWPLYVYTYRTELPGRPPFAPEGSTQKVDAHTLLLAHSGLDLAMIELTKELTVLAINSAVDYDLNFKINNFQIESAILDAVDETYVAEVAQGGGARKKLVGLFGVEDLTPKILGRCFKRANKLFPFTKGQLRATALAMGFDVPSTAPRELYCRLLQRDADYLERMQTAPLDPVRRPRRQRAPVALSALEASTPRTPGAPGAPSADSSYFSPPREAGSLSTGTYTDSSLVSVAKSLDRPKNDLEAIYKSEKFRTAMQALKDLPFEKFQQAIIALYETYKWESPIVKNGCGVVAAGKHGEPVSFTRTQDFVRHYLTPASPFKGLLAWHSVGTGKTCMAVAAASDAFESAGYTILWVTRNALMSDVYKNIFGAVCSIPIMEAVKKSTSIPEDLAVAKRMLSRAWLPPITYRMFQNALQGKNELGRMLAAKHRSDPLHKTFLIMDEVHKLMDGDLSPAESADFSVIQSYIHKSYAVSKDASVRPLLMTATPITDTPHELFTILNTLISTPGERLMDFEKFRAKYATPEGQITAEGRAYFQDRAKGLISYLNREYDPTTFAQPVFEDVPVPAGGVVAPSLDDLVARCTADLELPEALEIEDCEAMKKAMESELATSAAKELTRKRKLYKKSIAECVKRNRQTRKAHGQAVKSLLKEAHACYLAQKQALGKSTGPSQLSEIEACFGKKAKGAGFPSKSEFTEAVRDYLHDGATAEVTSVSSNTGAVFNKNLD